MNNETEHVENMDCIKAVIKQMNAVGIPQQLSKVYSDAQVNLRDKIITDALTYAAVKQAEQEQECDPSRQNVSVNWGALEINGVVAPFVDVGVGNTSRQLPLNPILPKPKGGIEV